jgi:PDZ domain-containing protein
VTETQTAPSPPPLDAPARRHSGRWWFAVISAAAVVALLIGAALIPLPYYALRPGSVRPTSNLIFVDGESTYRPIGSISYTTVNVRQVTVFGAIAGWLDDDVDVVEQEVILGSRDARANKQFNQQLMTGSKFTATQVALERLGYDVKISGSLIVDVAPGYPAEGVLEPGDAIVAVDGQPVDEPNDLTDLLGAHAVGDQVALVVDRAAIDEDEALQLPLAAAADDPSRGVLGVSVQDRDPTFPFDVTIDSGDVGGPSAGLAFTLGLIDFLTPGELTGGKPIATTGTIRPDGSVGPVGGVEQKTAAVRRAGIKVFFVPSAEFDEAVAKAGDDIEIVRVDTLDQALTALVELGGDPLPGAEPGAT